mmetsp:Transcript_3701/g.7642  ORF Transcript_3701/g.7642 Transcript_3701/m.7642 type:complete len:133 (+) Transcript_3701:349-747(+)
MRAYFEWVMGGLIDLGRGRSNKAIDSSCEIVCSSRGLGKATHHFSNVCMLRKTEGKIGLIEHGKLTRMEGDSWMDGSMRECGCKEPTSFLHERARQHFFFSDQSKDAEAYRPAKTIFVRECSTAQTITEKHL